MTRGRRSPSPPRYDIEMGVNQFEDELSSLMDTIRDPRPPRRPSEVLEKPLFRKVLDFLPNLLRSCVDDGSKKALEQLEEKFVELKSRCAPTPPALKPHAILSNCIMSPTVAVQRESLSSQSELSTYTVFACLRRFLAALLTWLATSFFSSLATGIRWSWRTSSTSAN